MAQLFRTIVHIEIKMKAYCTMQASVRAFCVCVCVRMWSNYLARIFGWVVEIFVPKK